MPSVTIKDIAKIAGVSHTTVSRALKDHPRIGKQTTERIKRIAKQMGYTPNTIAQSLAAKQTWTLGMVVTSIADPFITEVVSGAEQELKGVGYSLFLSNSHNVLEQEVAVVETFRRRRVDAIIVTASQVGSIYHAKLDQFEVPIVLINNQVDGQYLHSVSVDDVQGAHVATRHLIKQGHRRIAFVGSLDRPRSSKLRYLGYCTAFEEAGLSIEQAFHLSPIAEDDFTVGALSLPGLQRLGVSAVFCYNDRIAIGLLSACFRQGVRVPQALSIVGFDDIDAASFVTPPLTTMRQPRFEMGRRAARMALDLIAERDVQDQLLPCQLVTRHSTTVYQEQRPL